MAALLVFLTLTSSAAMAVGVEESDSAGSVDMVDVADTFTLSPSHSSIDLPLYDYIESVLSIFGDDDCMWLLALMSDSLPAEGSSVSGYIYVWSPDAVTFSSNGSFKVSSFLRYFVYVSHRPDGYYATTTGRYTFGVKNSTGLVFTLALSSGTGYPVYSWDGNSAFRFSTAGAPFSYRVFLSNFAGVYSSYGIPRGLYRLGDIPGGYDSWLSPAFYLLPNDSGGNDYVKAIAVGLAACWVFYLLRRMRAGQSRPLR